MDKAAEKKARDKVKRQEAKMAKVQNGLSELEIWLCDLVRGGLMALPEHPRSFWEGAAVRMVDAQATGMAAAIRQLRDLDYRTDLHWQEAALAIISRMWMAVRGFEKITGLPETFQADLKSQLGLGPGPKDVLNDPSAEAVRDQWLSVGCQTEQIDDITTQRNWLFGCQSGRFALVLYFAFKKMPIESTIQPGKVHDAELVFFPSATPLRAVIREQGPTVAHLPELHAGLSDWQVAEQWISGRLAQNPWSDHFPVLLESVKPFAGPEGTGICDRNNHILPLTPSVSALPVQQLLALSGGSAVNVFLLYRQQRVELLGIPFNGAFFLTGGTGT